MRHGQESSQQHLLPHQARQAAAAGMLIACRCNLCRRSRVYLASDLVPIFGPAAYVFELFDGRCPRSGSADSGASMSGIRLRAMSAC